MQDYVVVVVASLAGLFSLALLLFLCYCLLRNHGAFDKRKPERATSRVYPRISSPIYAISNNSIDKKPTLAGDTLRKLSVFDRKRSSAFSSKSLYYDHEASPRVAHKEYLDFNAIESILPRGVRQERAEPARTAGPSRERDGYYSNHYSIYRKQHGRHQGESVDEQGSFDSDETASTHVSKESLESEIPPCASRGRISIIEERPFGGHSVPPPFEPVQEIYRENHVSYDRE